MTIKEMNENLIKNGSPFIKISYCENCGNKETIGILDEMKDRLEEMTGHVILLPNESKSGLYEIKLINNDNQNEKNNENKEYSFSNPMKCPNCGTTDINHMLVDFRWSDGREDTTTLPKLLQYLRYPTVIGTKHPEDFTSPSETGEKAGILPEIITFIWCDHCSEGRKEDKEIPPTRYGV